MQAVGVGAGVHREGQHGGAQQVPQHGACGGYIPGLACHKGSVNGKSSYSHIGRHTKKI